MVLSLCRAARLLLLSVLHPTALAPSALQAACTSAASLAGIVGAGANALPAGLLQPLVAALCHSLAHQHSRVRLAALQALHALVQRGMPVAMMQDGVLPAVRPLAHDHAPAIRAALFTFVAEWGGSTLAAGGGDGGAAAGGSAGDDEGRAANQCRTFLPLLLPLLLLGLTDEVEAIRSDTFAQLEAIGAVLAKHKVGGGATLAGLLVAKRCGWHKLWVGPG